MNFCSSSMRKTHAGCPKLKLKFGHPTLGPLHAPCIRLVGCIATNLCRARDSAKDGCLNNQPWQRPEAIILPTSGYNLRCIHWSA
jgi:hypothetical protein